MFGDKDPRAALAPRIAGAARRAKAFGQSSHVKFALIPPATSGPEGPSWYARGQHFLVGYTEARPGALIERVDHPDEHMILAPDTDRPIEIDANGETMLAPGGSLVIAPPGTIRLRAPQGGRIVRIFSTLAEDLNALSANAETYGEPHPNIAPYAPWPEPVGGHRLRRYDLDVPVELQKHGRIWRSRNLMIYLSPARHGPRDIHRVTPHAHEDFEQGTFNLEGDAVQHVRFPWATDMALWREDEHEQCPRHSLSVFPAHAIHTTQYIGEGANVELVIYGPPRLDWSRQPGWVLNHDDYPMPPEEERAGA